MQLSVDIGTCFSKASFVLKGKVAFVKDPVYHTHIYPSSAYMDSQDKIWVGQKAENQHLADPIHYQRYFKLDLGSRKPYTLGKNTYSETLMAAVMWKLKKDAEQVLGNPFTTAIITVPRSYKEQKDKNSLVQWAGKHVGFSRVELLEEAVAVAAYYDAERGISDKEFVLVYDLGGTFEAAVIQKRDSHYKCLSRPISTERCGGGVAFDNKIYEDLTLQLQKTHSALSSLLNLSNKDPEALRLRGNLHNFCSDLKHQLSDSLEVARLVQLDLAGISPVPFSLTQREFQAMIAPFIEETINYCSKLVSEAGIGWRDIGQVLLVGGSCRIPYIKQRLEQKLQRSVTQLKDLDTTVCQGAAIYKIQPRPSSSDLFATLIKLVQDFLPKEDGNKRTVVVPVMTYEAAIKYFVTNLPPDSRIQKGAILRRPHQQGQIFIQVFLDENNTPVCRSDGRPYARQLVVRQFDTELGDTFGDLDLIIIE